MREALTAFVATTDIPLRYAPDAIRGQRGNALTGTFAPGAALRALLAGTGLTGRIVDGEARVGAAGEAPSARLPATISVRAPEDDPPPPPAAPEAQPADVGTLDTIVVTGTRTPHRIVDSPVEVRLITAADIRASGAGNLAELLEREGGLHVARVAGRGKSVDIEIQGLSSEHVLVLIDGLRVVGRIDGALDLTRFRTAAIERVEIVRGPTSALYGSDALGGVINIITRSGGDGASLTVRGDSDENLEAYGDFGWDRGAWRGSVSGGAVTRESFDLDASTPATDGPEADGRYFSTHQQLDATDTVTIDARFDYALDDTERLDPGTGSALTEVRKRTEELRAALSPRIALGRDTDLRLDAYYTRFYDQYVSEVPGTDADDVDERTYDDLYTVGGQLDHRIGRHRVSIGAEHQYEELDADRLDETGERDRQALFVQDEVRLLDGRLTVVPGLRYDRDSQFGRQWSPKLNLRYDLTDAWVLRAGYGQGYRAPSFRELLLRFDNPGVGYRVEGNPDLEPERSNGYNLGAIWYPADTASLSLSVFHHDVDDLIEIVQIADGPPILFSYRNVARARITGGDIQAEWQPWRPLALRLGYGYVDAEDRDTGEPLSGRPEHRVNAAARFERERWALGVRGVWVGERRFGLDIDTGGAPTPTGTADPYALFALRAEWDGWQWFDLAVGVDNLLDEGDPRFLPIQPRAVYLELRKELFR